MMPRPVVRWKSFWLGVLLLGFFGWASVRSFEGTDGISFVQRHGLSLFVEHRYGRVIAVCDRDYFRARGIKMRMAGPGLSFTGSRLSGSGKPRSIPLLPAFRVVSGESVTRLVVTYWFLVLLFLVPWLAFLFWRVRKQKK